MVQPLFAHNSKQTHMNTNKADRFYLAYNLEKLPPQILIDIWNDKTLPHGKNAQVTKILKQEIDFDEAMKELIVKIHDLKKELKKLEKQRFAIADAIAKAICENHETKEEQNKVAATLRNKHLKKLTKKQQKEYSLYGILNFPKLRDFLT